MGPGNLGSMTRLAKFAWATLAFNISVVVFGAYVRATGSGAGCGRSWPTCAGQLIPEITDSARQIEFTHRAMSGLALVAVAVLLVSVYRSTSKGHPARKAVLWSTVTIIGEALIGAMIVLAEWVADDASVARAVAVPLHLGNTFLLLGSLTLTAGFLSGGSRIAPERDGSLWRLVLIGIGGMVLIGATGAVAALADTLFPAESLRAGIVDDFSGTSSFLTRLRLLHPVVSMTVGAFLGYLGWSRGVEASGWAQRFAVGLIGIVVLQVFAGLVNVFLLTPVWMQLVHLLLADLLWVCLVLFAAASLEERTEMAPQAA